MRKVSKAQLIIFIPLALITSSFVIIAEFLSNKKLYYFLTFWQLWANTLYIFMITLCDCVLFFFNTPCLEKVNSFFRNIFSRYCFTFSYAVAFLYWSLLSLGPSFLHARPGLLPYVFHLYCHGGNTLILLLDFYMNEYKNLPYSFTEMFIISVIFWFYGIVVCYAKYYDGINPYAFMEKAEIRQLIVAGIMFYIIVLNSYQAHLLLLRKKANSKERSKEETKMIEIEQKVTSSSVV